MMSNLLYIFLFHLINNYDNCIKYYESILYLNVKSFETALIKFYFVKKVFNVNNF